jgi:predicted aspartyl protease
MRIPIAVILMLCATAISAYAEDCRPLSYITGVPMNAESVPVIPVMINNTSANMMIDTGGAISQLTWSAAQALGVKPVKDRVFLTDVSGNSSLWSAQTKTFQMGAIHLDNMQFHIAPAPLGSLTGLLAPGLLIHYDLDMDFSNNRLNFFSPDHCEGNVIYWPEKTVGIIPIAWRNGHMTVPITIDGQTVSGIIDTGTLYTTMNREIARWPFGLTRGALGPPLPGHVNGDQKIDTYEHIFSAMTFGDVTVKNVHMHIDFHADSEIKLKDTSPEVIIGMNVLRKLHLYIAFKERKLYVTPPSPDAAKALPPVFDYAAVKP